MKDIRTIILAAGKGTRMKSDVPKVLHKICGKPILQYLLDIVKTLGSAKTYVVLGYKSDLVKNFLSGDISVIEQKKLLGTADAIKSTAKYFKNYRGDILILCGDTPLLRKATIKNVVRKHKQLRAACTFLTAVVHDSQGYGRVIRDEKGVAVCIREDKDAVGYERQIAEINVGVYCFCAQQLFNTLKTIKINQKKKEFYLTDMIGLLTGQGLKVETLETEDPFEALGINTREDLAKAQAILCQRTLKDFMLQGVTISDPSSTYINTDVVIGKDTTIYPFTYIEDNVRIGERCVIGPYAHLRAGTKINHDVHIGNFTEVSRSQIGQHSMMKHFSYLGDSRVGSKVNIGAGAVTANFDGKQKNITKISDNAFIGSDSVLIAPVKIGRRAIVGAGSVLTKGKVVPDGCVAVGVPAQITSRRNC